jgi:hypothetical protein
MTTLREMVLEAVKSYNGPCTNSQIMEYINKKWPGQNPGSINDHINAASVNLPGRINYPENQKEVDTPRNGHDFLFWRARGNVELYDPSIHGKWGIAFYNGKYRIYRDIKPVPEHRNQETVKGNVHSLSVTDGRPYQTALKRGLMEIYGNKCAICDMDIPEILRASHIIPHSENEETARRLDNAILLCSLHDSLFDEGFITIIHDNGNYTIKVSKDLTKSKSNAAIQICSYLNGAQFHVPTNNPPSEDSLKYHYDNIFRG